MPRPVVDIVVPFAGAQETLAPLVRRLEAIQTRPGDTVTVVDNRPPRERGPFPRSAGIRCVVAAERQSSYHARNRGAAAGANPWIVFLDADVAPEPGLLDAYFTPAPAPDTGVLAGAIADARPDDAVAAGVADHASLGDAVTLDRPSAYAQTANAAVRRAAFEQAGGFEGAIRSGGDADLCFRLRALGWGLERRPEARVTHAGRAGLWSLAGQKARHGAGAAWLDRRWPGALPPASPPARGLAGDVVRALARFAAADRAAARAALVRPTTFAAFHVGRRLSNAAPAGRRRWTPRGRWLR